MEMKNSPSLTSQWTVEYDTSCAVGYYDIHPNISINFQMNRWYSWTNDDEMLAEMQKVASKIKDYRDVRHVFTQLSEQALNENHILRAAFYLRMAEFFMFTDDPAKLVARNQFVQLMCTYFEIPENAKHKIPYQNGNLTAYHFTPTQSKGTLVIFGGFDSYIEEFFPILFRFYKAGYEVICFEGPGQGATLEDYQLPMTPEWEKPVKAILDYFDVNDVTLLGLSLGGYLVVRAAAYEQRIHRVVAWDIIDDAWECSLNIMKPIQRKALRILVTLKAAPIVNYLAYKASKSDLMMEWGVKQAMHVFGASSPYKAFHHLLKYHTHNISQLVRQDTLILAGAEDHYVPLHLFFRQIQNLKNVKSLSARIFTREEQAQNHCQVGNIGLVIDTILNWVEIMDRKR
jgi:alpha-beta hydrolase superfamily lysophospholipase